MQIFDKVSGKMSKLGFIISSLTLFKRNLGFEDSVLHSDIDLKIEVWGTSKAIHLLFLTDVPAFNKIDNFHQIMGTDFFTISSKPPLLKTSWKRQKFIFDAFFCSFWGIKI